MNYLVGSLVSVVRILQQQSGGLGVVLLGGNVQRREMNLSTGVVLE